MKQLIAVRYGQIENPTTGSRPAFRSSLAQKRASRPTAPHITDAFNTNRSDRMDPPTAHRCNADLTPDAHSPKTALPSSS